MASARNGKQPLRVLIVGAGAVGLFYGSRLHKPERNVLVSLVCRSNYEAIKNNGVKLLTHTYGEYTFHPEHVFKSVDEAAHLHPSARNEDVIWDYVVVTTKALPRDSSSGANLIKPVVHPQTTIVLIQNGIGIEDPYHDAFPNNVLLSAVTVVSAEQIEQGVVRQNRWTRISVGPFTGGKDTSSSGGEKTKKFVELLKGGEIRDAEEYDERGLQFVRWHKIAINASFNPSSVLSNGAPNSVMAADPLLKTHILETMQEILHLATVVLQSPLPSKFASPERIIESTLRNTAQNFNKDESKAQSDGNKGESSRPSMWYDWAQGRPMELDAILGNVVREAERVNVSIPRTQSMYALLCMAQKRRDQQKKNVISKL